MTKNKDSTRYYSSIQENRVAKSLGGQVSSNSGAGNFIKSDVSVKEASLSIECKTAISEKQSFSIKKEWIEKHYKEAWSCGLSNTALAFSFGDDKDYYIIDSKLMKYLVEQLINDNN